ncbi:Uncharacterised protein [Shigella sonnei]|nr:Uncharacterised protein [Shigella sonnei]CSF38317.1 Uncharacterised protein [Shigella sonnei]CSF59122.1 Uncharacterised protein [Shigella sonnei]CSF60880.1 Uncharacterised protein [Shigella sonnei]CSF95320.1 Uncharacterised protein [Shigella sonnei]
MQTASDANGVEDNPAGNDDSVQLQGMRNAKQPLHTLGHQRRGKAQTGTHREDQGDEIEVVDDSAEQPFGVFFTYQRHQCRAGANHFHFADKEEVSEGD